jgi:hypothetical protein
MVPTWIRVFLFFLFCQLKHECFAFDALNFYQLLNTIERTLALFFNALQREIHQNNVWKFQYCRIVNRLRPDCKGLLVRDKIDNLRIIPNICDYSTCENSYIRILYTIGDVITAVSKVELPSVIEICTLWQDIQLRTRVPYPNDQFLRGQRWNIHFPEDVITISISLENEANVTRKTLREL